MEIEEVKALGEKMDKVLESATAAQTLSKEAISKSGEVDVIVKDAIAKAAESSAKAAEELQELKLKSEAIQKTSEHLEKAFARMGGAGNDNEAKELSAKAGEQMARYLRKGIALEQDVVEAVIKLQMKNALYGVDSYVRENEIKTLIAGNNPQGGYFIRPERSAIMIKRIFETSPVRSVANIVSTSSDTMEFLIDDNEAASGGWVGETQPRGETATPNIGMLTIPVHEQFAQPKATQKMLEDAGFDVESWLSGNVTRKMSRFENTAFVVGDGSQKPRGFLSLPAWAQNGTYQRGAIEQIKSGVSGEFSANGVKALQNALIEDYQASAVFGIQRASWEQIITLVDGQGQYLLDPRSMKVGDDLTLLGKRVIFMNDIPGVAADALAMVYGDFSAGYTIVDRLGFRVIRDELTEKPYVKFYTTKRTGGDVTNYESLKIQKLAA